MENGLLSRDDFPKRLLPNQIAVFLFPIPSSHIRVESCLWGYLSPDEKKRGREFVKPEDQWRYIFCRGSLRQLLGRYLSVSPQSLNFHYTPYGKPQLGPKWGIYFNLSHTCNYLSIALSLEVNVGVDIEEIRDIDFRPLIQHYFSPDEKKSIYEQKSEEAKRREFFQCWVRKESTIKSLGMGLGNGIDFLQNVVWEENRLTIAKERTCHFVPLNGPEGHAIGLVYISPTPQVVDLFCIDVSYSTTKISISEMSLGTSLDSTSHNSSSL